MGHALKNDLQALALAHPAKATRDTARYPPLMRRAQAAPGGGGGKLRSRQLRVLAQAELGLAIQEAEHSPVDDARAALYLYHLHRKARRGRCFVACGVARERVGACVLVCVFSCVAGGCLSRGGRMSAPHGAPHRSRAIANARTANNRRSGSAPSASAA